MIARTQKWLPLINNKDYGLETPNIVKASLSLIKSRSEAIFLWIWQAAIFCMVAGQGFPPLSAAFITVASVAAITISVYVYNDIADADFDSLNPVKRKRSTLAAGLISKTYAKILVAFAGALGLIIAYLMSLQVLFFGLCYFLLFLAYSYPGIRLKRFFLIKEIVTTGGSPLIAMMASYGVLGYFSLPTLFASLLISVFGILVFPVVSDTIDEREDALDNVKSLARAMKWGRRVQLMGIGILFMMTITPLTYSRLGFSVILPISVVALSLILLRWGVLPLRSKSDVAMLLQARKLTIVYVLLIEIIMVVSTIIPRYSIP